MDPETRIENDESAGSERLKASLFAQPLILLVRLYQVTLSHLMGGQCRFQPTCSHYAIEALTTHGALKGSWLTIRRLVRCHPWGGFGYDPVPPTASNPTPTEKPAR